MLKKFKPTKIAVEHDSQRRQNERYAQYLAGNYVLTVNEVSRGTKRNEFTGPSTFNLNLRAEKSFAVRGIDAVMKSLYADAVNARLIKVPDSRHFIQWDQPTRFVAEVDALMK